jgi:predicted PurR-regulated permease PerM
MWWFAFMLALVLNWLAESLSMRLMPPPLAITVSLIKVGFLIYIIPVAFHCVRIVREIQERLDARRSGL